MSCKMVGFYITWTSIEYTSQCACNIEILFIEYSIPQLIHDGMRVNWVLYKCQMSGCEVRVPERFVCNQHSIQRPSAHISPRYRVTWAINSSSLLLRADGDKCWKDAYINSSVCWNPWEYARYEHYFKLTVSLLLVGTEISLQCVQHSSSGDTSHLSFDKF